MKVNTLAVSLALVAALTAPASWADCPVSVLWSCGSDAGIPSTLLGATTEGGVEPWSIGEPCLEGCYDIVHGALEARGSSGGLGPSCGSGAEMVDDYWIVGPPSAQPLAFEVLLLADVTITGTSRCDGQLWPPYLGFSTTSSGPQSVVAPLTKSVGEVFRLEAHLGTWGGGPGVGSAHATASLRFRGLPAGYSIVSCHGYALTTPARSASWGGVKSLYR